MPHEKLAVVTGASAGIGKAVAERLSANGWLVAGIARRPAEIAHPAYRHHTLDLSDGVGVERYFESKFMEAYPAEGLKRVALVNNAGVLEPMVLYPKISMAAVEHALRVNTAVPLWLTGYFLRAYPRAALRIVNVSSGAAHTPRSGWAVYCATKAALHMAGRVFGVEADEESEAYAGRDLALLDYEPGVVDTAMQTLIRGTAAEDFPGVERFIGFHEEGVLNPPERPAAEICAFLESDPTQVFNEGKIGR